MTNANSNADTPKPEVNVPPVTPQSDKNAPAPEKPAEKSTSSK